MPRRVDDFKQPKRAPTAGDLGQEAYEANLKGGTADLSAEGRGSVPIWRRPEPHNPPPGQHDRGHPTITMGQDPK